MKRLFAATSVAVNLRRLGSNRCPVRTASPSKPTPSIISISYPSRCDHTPLLLSVSTDFQLPTRQLYAIMITSKASRPESLHVTYVSSFSGHLNNAVYVQYADSIINEYLTHHCGLEATSGTTSIGLIVSSTFKYIAPLSFPAPVIAGLAIIRCVIHRHISSAFIYRPHSILISIGRSSVRYAISLFSAEEVESDHLPLNTVAGAFTKSTRLTTATAAAYGEMVHVFVDPKSRRPTELPWRVRSGLERIKAAGSKL